MWLLETRHREFHHALIGSCGSPRLLGLADQLHAETQRYRLPSLAGGTASAARDIAREHRELMEAALARESVTAVALLSSHYRTTARAVEAALRAG